MDIFNDVFDVKEFELELVVLIDGSLYFVMVIYYLEGDGFFIFSCYECLVSVLNLVVVDVYFNFEGVVS